ncbi:hypothetical protein FG071_13690 [Vibrio cholerae]|nr:hypothetical protein [Vibrio cholerae]EKA4522901.1 hypothetical protein [Vibrio cholerae]
MNHYEIVLEMYAKNRCIGTISKKVSLPEAYAHGTSTKTKLKLSKDVAIETPLFIDSVDAESQTAVLKNKYGVWISSKFKQQPLKAIVEQLQENDWKVELNSQGNIFLDEREDYLSNREYIKKHNIKAPVKLIALQLFVIFGLYFGLSNGLSEKILGRLYYPDMLMTIVNIAFVALCLTLTISFHEWYAVRKHKKNLNKKNTNEQHNHVEDKDTI